MSFIFRSFCIQKNIVLYLPTFYFTLQLTSGQKKEMMYLTETPVILDGSKLQKMIHHIPLTDGTKSLNETIDWIKLDLANTK